MKDLAFASKRRTFDTRRRSRIRWGITTALHAVPGGLAYLWIELESFLAGAMFLAATAVGFCGSLALLALTAVTSKMWGAAPLIDCGLFRPPLHLVLIHLPALGAWAWALAAFSRPYAALAFGAIAVSWAIIWLIPRSWKPPVDPTGSDNVAPDT